MLAHVIENLLFASLAFAVVAVGCLAMFRGIKLN